MRPVLLQEKAAQRIAIDELRPVRRLGDIGKRERRHALGPAVERLLGQPHVGRGAALGVAEALELRSRHASAAPEPGAGPVLGGAVRPGGGLTMRYTSIEARSVSGVPV